MEKPVRLVSGTAHVPGIPNSYLPTRLYALCPCVVGSYSIRMQFLINFIQASDLAKLEKVQPFLVFFIQPFK